MTDGGADPNADADEAGTDGDAGGMAVRRDRFSGGPAREFLSSLAADEAIFGADLAVDRAHVVMLAEQEILADATAGEILGALEGIEMAGHGALPDGEDVHEAIETAVIDRIGPDGGRMHTARSRNDEVATCLRYRLRTDVLDVVDAALALRGALADAAAAHVGTVMPGYTHLQPAQPTTVAHYLRSYEAAVGRDVDRLLDVYDRTNRSPLGAAAFAGTPFDVDRERTADLLGFDGTVSNAMDAVSARDFLAETAAALATLAATLSGLAEDLILFANKGFVDLDDDYASTSSIMPQKKNPDSLELVRGVAGDAVGTATGTLTALKGLPRAYNRDLQRVHPPVLETATAVGDAADVAGGAVDTLAWDAGALAAAAGEGFATATGVADLLAAAGMPFRTAHEVVAAAAAAADGDVEPADIDVATKDVTGDSVFDRVSRADIVEALDPVESVASRDSAGGPASDAVRADLSAARETLAADRRAADKRRDALADAAADLRREVARYV